MPENSIRPQTTIYPWFENDWNKLQKIPKDKVPHAMLFSGLSGMGRESFIEHYIALLLCQKPTSENEACHHCQACALFEANNHADYYRLKRLENKKTLGIDQIRELIEWLSISSLLNQKKVLFIPNAEKLTLSASNALLKTLEEPPGNTVILLLTEYPQQLLATIRSRCIHYALQKASVEQALLLLQELLPEHPDRTLKLLLNLSQNSPFKAIELVNSNELEQGKKVISTLKIIALSQESPVLEAKNLFKSFGKKNELKKEPIELLVFWLHSLVQDLIRLKMTNNTDTLVHQDNIDTLLSIKDKTKTRELFELYDELQRFYQLTANQLNPQLLLETYLIKWKNCCLME